MSKGPSKLIIEQAIRDAIEGKVVSEGPVDFVKGVAGGIKGAAQVTMGNYRVNNTRSKIKTFADKTNKQLEKVSQDVAKSASKMIDSSNPAVSSTGQQLQDIMSDVRKQLQGTLDTLEDKFPAAVAGVVASRGQTSQQPQQQNPQVQQQGSRKRQEANDELERLAKDPEFMKYVKVKFGKDNLDNFPRDMSVIRGIYNKYQTWAERQRELEDLKARYQTGQVPQDPNESLSVGKITHKINFPSTIKSLVGESITKVFQNEAGSLAIPPPPPDDENVAKDYLKAPKGNKAPSGGNLKAPSIPKSEKETVPPPFLRNKQKESFSSMEEVMESNSLKDQIFNSIQERKKLSGKKK